jgi:hypothetical protein
MTIRGIFDISQMDLRKSKKPSLFNCLVIRDTLPFHDFQIIRNFWPESDHSFESIPKISSKSALITIEILNETYLILWPIFGSRTPKPISCPITTIRLSKSVQWLDIKINLIFNLIAKFHNHIFRLRFLFCDFTKNYWNRVMFISQTVLNKIYQNK